MAESLASSSAVYKVVSGTADMRSTGARNIARHNARELIKAQIRNADSKGPGNPVSWRIKSLRVAWRGSGNGCLAMGSFHIRSSKIMTLPPPIWSFFKFYRDGVKVFCHINKFFVSGDPQGQN